MILTTGLLNDSQSLAALDQPLGTRAPREPKQPKAATAPAPAPAKDKAAAVSKAPAPPKEVDPAVAAKQAEEDEKKRKRAERFGAPVRPPDPLPGPPGCAQAAVPLSQRRPTRRVPLGLVGRCAVTQLACNDADPVTPPQQPDAKKAKVDA